MIVTQPTAVTLAEVATGGAFSTGGADYIKTASSLIPPETANATNLATGVSSVIPPATVVTPRPTATVVLQP